MCMSNAIHTSACIIENEMNSLPDEILLKIFSYFSPEDVCFTIGKVCQQWSSLTQSVSLWRQLTFVCDKNRNAMGIMNAISQMPLLKAIMFQWRTDVHILITELCNSCVDIRRIEFVCCGYVKANSIKMLTEHYPLLEVFSLGKCWNVEPDCFYEIPKFTNLRCLDLSHSKAVNGHTLFEITSSCKFLKVVNIDYIRNLQDSDMLDILEEKKNKLLSLSLFGEALTDSTYLNFVKCEFLHTLHLSCCSLITDKGLLSISKMQSLTSLKLRRANRITTMGIANFLLTPLISKLKHLILSRLENINDSAVYNISTNGTNLIYLELVYCPNITLQSKVYVLNGCKKLKKLTFRNNGGSPQSTD